MTMNEVANAVPPRTILVHSGQFAQAVDDTEVALVRAGAAVLVRAGRLVQPIPEDRPAADGRKTQVTILKPLTTAYVAYLITTLGYTYMKYDARSRRLVPCDPPERILRGLLEKGQWAFPRVTGVVNVPTLRPDGTILDRPGYDPATGLWLQPDERITLPPIPTNSSREEAAAALDLLRALLMEFPFVRPLDRAVALAALLTAVLRGAFGLAPAFLFRAPTAGSGKSYLVDLIATIITGRWCPVIAVPRNQEEFEKKLGALLLEGVPIISLDNASVDLSGDQLCQMTERPVTKVRVLGRSETPECEWRGCMFATGNNVVFSGDMTRRGLVCNLDPQVERPETRRFESNPMGMIAAARGKYIGAALTVARYRAAVSCTPLGSYEAWSRVVRSPLIALGEKDPVLSIEQSRMEDPEKANHAALIELWRKHLGTTQAYSTAELMNKVVNITEFRDLLVVRAGTPRGDVDGKRLGWWLRSISGRVVGGWRIVPFQRNTSGNRYIVQAVPTPQAEPASFGSGQA